MKILPSIHELELRFCLPTIEETHQLTKMIPVIFGNHLLKTEKGIFYIDLKDDKQTKILPVLIDNYHYVADFNPHGIGLLITDKNEVKIQCSFTPE